MLHPPTRPARVWQVPTMGGGRGLSYVACSVSKPQFEQMMTAPQNDHSNTTQSARRVSCSATTSARGLLALRGVGPVNARLLLAQQIESVDMLKEIYQTTCRTDKQELQRYLMEVVGFRNPAHSRSVADHLDRLIKSPSPWSVKLAVEGNIGAGKSTFLNVLSDGQLELQDIVEVVPEPVDAWRQVPNGNEQPINLLDRFYQDPKRYAYTFQHYVLLTRMEKDRAARASTKPIRILERSIFSDRMVFVRAMHEAGFMGDLELSVYDSWFSMEVAQDRALTPDGFIYLKARPETCIKRLRTRNRSEEAGVDTAYLENLHDKHESWLHFGARHLDEYIAGQELRLLETKSSLQRNPGGLYLSPALAANSKDGRSLQLGKPEFELLQSAPASIRDYIVFLGDGNVSTSGQSEEGKISQILSGVPALVLDHEQEDILYDRDARQDYAKKVKDFSQYVGSLRSKARQSLELEPAKIGAGVSLSPDQVDSLKKLLEEYKKFVQLQKSQPRGLELELRSIDRHLSRFTSLT